MLNYGQHQSSLHVIEPGVRKRFSDYLVPQGHSLLGKFYEPFTGGGPMACVNPRCRIPRPEQLLCCPFCGVVDAFITGMGLMFFAQIRNVIMTTFRSEQFLNPPEQPAPVPPTPTTDEVAIREAQEDLDKLRQLVKGDLAGKMSRFLFHDNALERGNRDTQLTLWIEEELKGIRRCIFGTQENP